MIYIAIVDGFRLLQGTAPFREFRSVPFRSTGTERGTERVEIWLEFQFPVSVPFRSMERNGTERKKSVPFRSVFYIYIFLFEFVKERNGTEFPFHSVPFRSVPLERNGTENQNPDSVRISFRSVLRSVPLERNGTERMERNGAAPCVIYAERRQLSMHEQ